MMESEMLTVHLLECSGTSDAPLVLPFVYAVRETIARCHKCSSVLLPRTFVSA